ncbi:MAG: hypothetical protein ACRETC_10925, partial [Gammaproteobacteria bacterium]
MKTRNLIAPMTLAVAMAFAAPLAFSADNGITDPINENVNVNVNKSVSNTKDISVKGTVKVKGTINVKSDAEALTKADQQSTNNTNENYTVNDNIAHINGNAASNAQGNIQLNVTAGDNNVQANNAAIAAQDKNDVFGRLDAETYVDQLTSGNRITNQGTPVVEGSASGPVTNTAEIGGNALSGAQGNINVNVSGGDDNVQANSVAMAVGNANLANASAISYQSTGGQNSVSNTYVNNTASLGGNALQN